MQHLLLFRLLILFSVAKIRKVPGFVLGVTANMESAEARDYTPDGPVAREIALTIPYYPFKGIERFYDVGGMLAQPSVFQKAIDAFAARYSDLNIDSIGCIDARGFILGPPIALALNKPCFMVRKKGKMPNTITGSDYRKEYKGDNQAGADALSIQKHSVKTGDRVLLIDDLVATGGTLLAAIELVEAVGGQVVECACMVELKFLDARTKIKEKHPNTEVWGLISEDVLTVAGAVEGSTEAGTAAASSSDSMCQAT